MGTVTRVTALVKRLRLSLCEGRVIPQHGRWDFSGAAVALLEVGGDFLLEAGISEPQLVLKQGVEVGVGENGLEQAANFPQTLRIAHELQDSKRLCISQRGLLGREAH